MEFLNPKPPSSTEGGQQTGYLWRADLANVVIAEHTVQMRPARYVFPDVSSQDVVMEFTNVCNPIADMQHVHLFSAASGGTTMRFVDQPQRWLEITFSTVVIRELVVRVETVSFREKGSHGSEPLPTFAHRRLAVEIVVRKISIEPFNISKSCPSGPDETPKPLVAERSHR